MKNLTTEEKIDYIYNTLKKQESRVFWLNIFKWGFRLLVIFYLLYFYYYTLPGIISSFKEAITPNISSTSFDFDGLKKIFSK